MGTAVTDENGHARLPYIISENDLDYFARFRGSPGNLAPTTEETENPDFILVLAGRTELTVGAIDGEIGQVVTLVATLRRRSDGAGVPNREITFRIPGNERVTATTDGSGTARREHKLDGPPFSGTGMASFEGDDYYQPAQSAFGVMIRKFDVLVDVADVRGKAGTRVTLRATLIRTIDNQPLNGRTLEFFVRLNNGTWESKGTDRTDERGRANINNVFLHPQWAGTTRKIRVKFDGGEHAKPAQGDGNLRTDP